MKNYLTVFFLEVSLIDGKEANKFRKHCYLLTKNHKVSKILICKKGSQTPLISYSIE
jgi:hypothetical protein